MARGTPDWSQVAPQELLGRVLDDAELAARLGSPSLFERRGNVVYLTDFSEGRRGWQDTNTSVGSFARTSHRKSYFGGYSVRISSGMSAVTPHRLLRDLPLMATTHIGVEVVMTVDFATVIGGVLLNFQDGATNTLFGLRIDWGDDDLERFDDTGAWVDVDPAFFASFLSSAWTHAKLVVDPVAGEYVRAQIGDQSYDLSGLAGFDAGATTTRSLTVILEGLDDTGASRAAHFGAVVVTVNE